MRSNKVFDKYSTMYWSERVEYEYFVRSNEKLNNISLFLSDLILFLEFDKEFYTSDDLMKFALQRYCDGVKNDVISSIRPFWNLCFGSVTQVSFHNLIDAINNFFIVLRSNYTSKVSYLKNNLKLVSKRTKDYHDLGLIIGSKGAGENDVKIALDGHDFACKSTKPVDFVTFDDKLYQGSLKAKNLCFSSIKGEYDFN